MKTAFINSNMRASFVYGSIVYEVQCSHATAEKLVAIWQQGQREFCTKEQAIAADAIESLITCDVSVGNRCELEGNGDPRILVANRKPNPPKPARVKPIAALALAQGGAK